MGNLWEEAKKSLATQVAEQTYQTWFEPIRFLAQEDGRLTLKVPSQFFYDWVKSHYGRLIEQTVSRTAGKAVTVDYSILLESEKNSDAPPSFQETPEKTKPSAPQFETQLNSQFQFENFIIGSCNQFAAAAARAVVASESGNQYNPLVIYGGVGLGKTHLLHATGNAFLRFHPNKRVRYLSSDRFTLEFINAIKENRTAAFSRFYRSVDLLIVDDIQFFQKKERTQEEFFHIFNELYLNGKRIVLSTDQPPSELGLQERLISRFNAGLIVDIQVPDFETRVAILRKKAEENGMEIGYDVLEFLALHIDSNVRDLQGALIRLLAYSSLVKKDIGMELAHQVINDILGKRMKQKVTLESIIEGVCEVYGVKKIELIGKSRRKEIAFARQVAMYLSQELTDNTLKSIGLFFGGRDHSTVIHARDLIARKMESDDLFRAQINTLRRRLAGPFGG